MEKLTRSAGFAFYPSDIYRLDVKGAFRFSSFNGERKEDETKNLGVEYTLCPF